MAKAHQASCSFVFLEPVEKYSHWLHFWHGRVAKVFEFVYDLKEAWCDESSFSTWVKWEGSLFLFCCGRFYLYHLFFYKHSHETSLLSSVFPSLFAFTFFQQRKQMDYVRPLPGFKNFIYDCAWSVANYLEGYSTRGRGRRGTGVNVEVVNFSQIVVCESWKTKNNNYVIKNKKKVYPPLIVSGM